MNFFMPELKNVFQTGWPIYKGVIVFIHKSVKNLSLLSNGILVSRPYFCGRKGRVK
jgi:hypothetical protein